MKSPCLFLLKTCGICLFCHLSGLNAQSTPVDKVDSLLRLAYADTLPKSRIYFIQIAESISDNCMPCMARCLGEKGLFYCQQGIYAAGYDAINAAIKLRRQLGDSLRVAGNFTNIAIFKLEEGKYLEAISAGNTAQLILEEQHRLKNASRLTDTLIAHNLAASYNVLSNIHSDFGNSQQALEYALKAYFINLQIGHQPDFFNACYTLANRYFLKHQESGRVSDADSSAMLYQQFLQFAENSPEEVDTVDMADTYHNLASLAVSRGNYPAARQAIDQAVALYKAEQDLAGLIDVEILKANVLIGEKADYPTAMKHMRAVQKLMAEAAVDTIVQLEIYTLLSECFEAVKQPDSALIYSRLAEKLNTRLFHSRQNKFNQSVLALNKSLARLELKEKQLEIDKSQARQRLWASLAAILGLLSLVGALIWRQREQKQQMRIARYNQEIEDTLKDAQVRFLQGIIEGQQIERKETQHILHNDIANTVLSLSYHIENTQPPHPAQKDWAAELQKLAAHARKLSHQMGGIIHDVGLFEGIQDLIRRIEKTKLIEVEFVSNLDKIRLEPQVEVGIWQIVQEMVSNTLKHARATRIELSIETDGRAVYIMYHDNGIGFDYEKMISSHKSLGLQSIREKTNELGGNTPEMISFPNQGLTISIEIPLHKLESP